MNKLERLFVGTLEDIESKLSSPSEYNLIRLSALLRQLLTDSRPLINLVNRNHRLGIRFEVTVLDSRRMPDPTSLFWIEFEGIDPTVSPFRFTEQLKLEHFLKRPILKHQSQMFTIHDLIIQVAHIDGGVHLGTPTHEIEKKLVEINSALFVSGIRATLGLLPPIARVVLRALEPLRLAVIASH